MNRRCMMSKFADSIDAANELADQMLTQHLAEHRARVANSCPVSSVICIDCGEPIPDARRLAVVGCERCIECQQFVDKTARR